MATGKIKEKTHAYFYAGPLVNGVDDPVFGYGVAELHLIDHIATIYFDVAITTKGTTTTFAWGINQGFFYPTIGRRLTPIEGGMICYTYNAQFDYNHGGYGGFCQVNGDFWTPARLWSLPANLGGWPANETIVGSHIFGTIFGTY